MNLLNGSGIMKNKILCIVGKSASGKSTVADYINENYNIPTLQSWTDRPKRSPDETGHTFVTPEEFNKFNNDDMIAFTKFGDKRYCCFHKDLKEKNLYVIDPTGLEFLKDNFSDRYDIKSMYIFRYASQRFKDAGYTRFIRYKGMYHLPTDYYDYYIMNTEGFNTTKQSIDEVVKDFFDNKVVLWQ